MPAYRFQAADAAGVLHRGIVDADSSRQARAIIRERGQTPIEVVALSAEQNAGHINLGGRLKDADLALCTRQLSSLLTARLPLEKALNAVVEQAQSARVRERFAAVRSDVVSGQTLTAAMAKFPRDFPDTYRALISAGEQSGDLAQVMSRLAAYVENRTQLVSKVKMAFTYPIIVAVVAVLVIIALLTYVVPQVVQVFNQTRQDLPLLTLILIRTSDFIRNWGWLVLLGLGGAWAAFHYSLKAPTARLSFHSKLLNMPMFGRLVRGINAARHPHRQRRAAHPRPGSRCRHAEQHRHEGRSARGPGPRARGCTPGPRPGCRQDPAAAAHPHDGQRRGHRRTAADAGTCRRDPVAGSGT